MWWHPDLLIGVFTPGWITWTDYMPIWAARRLILCLHSTERSPTEYAQRQPPDSAPSAAFQVLSARRVRAALRRREARGRESTWWPQKWLSNQLTAFQLVIVFQHCFIYDSARYQPQHPHPSVCRGIWACEPQRSPQLCLRSCCFFFFHGWEQSWAEQYSTNIWTRGVSSVASCQQVCSLYMFTCVNAC